MGQNKNRGNVVVCDIHTQTHATRGGTGLLVGVVSFLPVALWRECALPGFHKVLPSISVRRKRQPNSFYGFDCSLTYFYLPLTPSAMYTDTHTCAHSHRNRKGFCEPEPPGIIDMGGTTGKEGVARPSVLSPFLFGTPDSRWWSSLLL